MTLSVKWVLMMAVLALVIAGAVPLTLSLIQAQSANGKYDTDGDRLIEIRYLEQLDAMRHDLDGNGRPDSGSDSAAYNAAFSTSGSERICVRPCNGYELMRSLDFSDASHYQSGRVNTDWTEGEGWLPIGTANDGFNTTLNGNGNTIDYLFIERQQSYVGLFGSTDFSSRIDNLGLTAVDVKGLSEVAAMAGRNGGSVTGSHATGTVEAWGRGGRGVVGGLIGLASTTSTTQSSYTEMAVKGNGHSVGGLVGTNEGSISASYAIGDVTNDNPSYGQTGGLAGRNVGGSIRNSYATGNVVARDHDTGGLVGLNTGTLIASYATGDVTSTDPSTGGLVGKNTSTVKDSYATGTVRGTSYVGGLVGQNDRIISVSYATGDALPQAQELED